MRTFLSTQWVNYNNDQIHNRLQGGERINKDKKGFNKDKNHILKNSETQPLYLRSGSYI